MKLQVYQKTNLLKAVQFSDPSIYAAGGYGLESDFHNNFGQNHNLRMGRKVFGQCNILSMMELRMVISIGVMD